MTAMTRATDRYGRARGDLSLRGYPRLSSQGIPFLPGPFFIAPRGQHTRRTPPLPSTPRSLSWHVQHGPAEIGVGKLTEVSVKAGNKGDTNDSPNSRGIWDIRVCTLQGILQGVRRWVEVASVEN